MPEIILKEVLLCTSEDDKFPAQNLLGNKCEGKWLSSATSKNKPTFIEATFRLSQLSKISALDIGNYGSAFITISVSRTGFSNFETLLPSSVMMSQQDIKNGLNKTSVRMFQKDNFIPDVREKQWDILRVVCSQPYYQSSAQYGLSFIRIFSFNEEASKCDFASSNKLDELNSLKRHEESKAFASRSPLTRTEKLIVESKKVTPKEMLPSSEEDTSLLRAAILSFLDSLKLDKEEFSNIKIVDLRQKFENIRSCNLSEQEKFLFVNIVKSFAVKISSRKQEVSKHSNNVPIGKDSRSLSNVKQIMKDSKKQINSPKRKKYYISKKENSRNYESSNFGETSRTNPQLCRNNLSLVDTNIVYSDESETTCNIAKHLKKEEPNATTFETSDVYVIDSDSSVEEVFSSHSTLNSSSNKRIKSDLIECPICQEMFARSTIEEHSASCMGKTERKNDRKEELCPVCCNMIFSDILIAHADVCARGMFGI